MDPRRLAAPAAAAVVVSVDQCTKAFASHAGVVAHNNAYAFGVIAGPRLALIAGVGVVIALFVVVVGRVATALNVSPVICAVVAGGMIGNALDRVFLGGARDFIHVGRVIVNLADVAVAAGLVALVVALAASTARRSVRHSGFGQLA